MAACAFLVASGKRYLKFFVQHGCMIYMDQSCHPLLYCSIRWSVIFNVWLKLVFILQSIYDSFDLFWQLWWWHPRGAFSKRRQLRMQEYEASFKTTTKGNYGTILFEVWSMIYTRWCHYPVWSTIYTHWCSVLSHLGDLPKKSC